MAVRSVEHSRSVAAPWSVSGTPQESRRPHHGAISRRSHRAAHAAAQRTRQRWMLIGGASLAVPFLSALLVLELVH